MVLVGEDVHPYADLAQGVGQGIHLGEGSDREHVIGLAGRSSDWNALSAAVDGLGVNRSARIRITAEGAWALTNRNLEHEASGP